MPSKKIDPTILEELLNEFQDQDYGELIAGIEAEPEEKPLEELIRKAYKDHELAKDMLAALHEQESSKACCWPKQIRKILHCNKSECSIVNGLIYYRNRLFVPDSPNLCLEVVHCTHGSGPAGHPGHIKTLDLLSRTYWWPGISQFTATFVKDCALCFCTKTPCSAPPGFLKPLELPAHPWTDISMDHVVDLPQCPHGRKAYRHIFVVVD